MIILKATSIELLEYKLAAWLDGYEKILAWVLTYGHMQADLFIKFRWYCKYPLPQCAASCASEIAVRAWLCYIHINCLPTCCDPESPLYFTC